MIGAMYLFQVEVTRSKVKWETRGLCRYIGSNGTRWDKTGMHKEEILTGT